MGIFNLIWNFFKGLGCFFLGLVIIIFIILIGIVFFIFGPIILAGIAGILILIAIVIDVLKIFGN